MLVSRLHEGVRNLLQQEQRKLSVCKNRIPSASYRCIFDAKIALLTARKDVVQAVTSYLSRHRHRLELLQQRLVDVSPEKLLARGYSITLKDGKVVKNVGLLNEGDEITTLLQKGEVTSIVNRKPSNRK
jgi:exodeoxyribonuclease VII large subunit